jgi:hypothetical protein
MVDVGCGDLATEGQRRHGTAAADAITVVIIATVAASSSARRSTVITVITITDTRETSADGFIVGRSTRAAHIGGVAIAIANINSSHGGPASPDRRPKIKRFRALLGTFHFMDLSDQNYGAEVPVPGVEDGTRAAGFEPAAGSVGVPLDGPG